MRSMIRVTLEVTNGPAARRVTVTAPTIERALAPYNADGPCTASVVFPIDPDGFFVPDDETPPHRGPLAEEAAEPVAA
jgi:hypothetical protein